MKRPQIPHQPNPGPRERTPQANDRCNPACAHMQCVPHSVRLPFTSEPTHFTCECAAILAKTASLAEANNASTIIIYGPQGCGKSNNAARIAQFFGKTNIVDRWAPGEKLPPDSLVLTHCNVAIIAFDDAISVVR